MRGWKKLRHRTCENMVNFKHTCQLPQIYDKKFGIFFLVLLIIFGLNSRVVTHSLIVTHFCIFATHFWRNATQLILMIFATNFHSCRLRDCGTRGPAYIAFHCSCSNLYFTPSTAKDRLRHQLAAPGLLRRLDSSTIISSYRQTWVQLSSNPIWYREMFWSNRWSWTVVLVGHSTAW